jgi:hypothetical protein
MALSTLLVKDGEALTLTGASLPPRSFSNPYLQRELNSFTCCPSEAASAEILLWLLAQEYPELAGYEVWEHDTDKYSNVIAFTLRR